MIKNRDNPRLAPLLIILSGSLWGIIGIFSKTLSANGLSPQQITFVRCALSAVLIWAFLFVFDRDKLRIRLRDIWMFIGTGILSLAFFSVMYFRTQQTANLSVAAVLLYTAPCFVMLLSAVFFKEKIGGRKIAALLLAFCGCVFTTGLAQMLVTGEAVISLGSALTGVASGLGYSLYTIFGNVALKKYSDVTVTAYTMLFAALSLLPFSLSSGLPSAFSQSGSLLAALGIALVSTILPYLLYTKGLKHTEPGRASVMAFVEPVVATLTGVLIFSETLTLQGVIGILLIFVSIVILNTDSRKKLQNG